MDYQSLRKHEFETTLRVLKAYPEDKIDMKPASKSRTAAELATVLASEERVIKALIETGATNPHMSKLEVPPTMGEIISLWREAASTNDALIDGLSPEDLAKSVDFYGMKVSLADALWVEMLDHIHHRGQFSVYLRLAGAKVPSIYGPTADAPMG
jgi:uncharacterized damage-inducible protein DinB